MAGLAFSTAQTILKEDYKDLREQLNQGFFMLAQIEKNTDDVVGRRAYHGVHISRNSGVGARASGGTLPTAGNQGYKQALVPMRFNYGRITVGGPVIKAMAQDRGSFVRAVRSEMDGISKDLKRDINRQIWGTSNGVIAACSTSTTTTVINMATTTTAVQFRQLWADGGSLIDIGTVATPTATASARSVTAYSVSGLTITISGANISTATTDRVFRSGAGGATDNTGDVGDGQSELTGLQSIVSSSGTLHSIDPSTYPVWVATKDSNSAVLRSVSENLVNKNIDLAEIASGEQVDLLVGSDGVSRALAATMQSMRRNVDTVALKAGYTGIAWSSPTEGMVNASKQRAVFKERDCPSNSLYGIATDSLVEYVMSDWEWMQEDGAILSRVSGQDAYEATYFRYSELACKQRNANFVIVDLTEA